MGNACGGGGDKTVADASPAVEQAEGAEKNGGPLRPTQSTTGAMNAEAVIQEIQRAATPLPKEQDDGDYQIIRLLLLGAAESGKTTILEQVRILTGALLSVSDVVYIHVLDDFKIPRITHCMHKQNFTEAELFHRKAFIYNNIMSSIRVLINRARQMGLKYSNEVNESFADLILSQDETQYGHFTPEIEKAIGSVWSDPTSQMVYSKRSEINLNDSTKYFLDAIESINRIDFRPTAKDLIMSYVPTVGVQNIIFTTNNRSFQLFDMGGQRIDRRKWATMYDGIDAIFFCLAVSEYDQVMDEDGVTNRLSDALSLLEKISVEPKFAETPIFLFLNEIDVFREKLEVFPLKNYLPDYNGTSVDEALKYIEQLAQERMIGHKNNHIFRTIATDTEQMIKILKNVFSILMEKT